jgi:hypothetical protein
MAWANPSVLLQGSGNVLARAGASVGKSLFNQLIQCLLVQRRPSGLQDHWRIRVQSTGVELLQDVLGCAGYGAGCVHIFDAHQPLPTMRACIEPTGQRRYE